MFLTSFGSALKLRLIADASAGILIGDAVSMLESMTIGISTMQDRAVKLVRVQEKGQVTLPAEVRRRLGLNKGDVVAVIQTEDGVFISPQKVVALKALDLIGEVLRAQGVSLDELWESGREIRGELVKEKYGLDPDAPPTA